MDTRNEKECKELFDKIVKSFKEYSAENCNINEESVKSKILDLLKNHRPVKIADYEYGLSHALKKNHRLIIKDEKDPSKVREFGKHSVTKYWYCSNITSSAKCSAATLKIRYGIVFSPIYHSDIYTSNQSLSTSLLNDTVEESSPPTLEDPSENNRQRSLSIKTTKEPSTETTQEQQNKSSLSSQLLEICGREIKSNGDNDMDSMIADTTSISNLTNDKTVFDSSSVLSEDSNTDINAATISNPSNLKRKNNDNAIEDDVENRVTLKRPKIEKVEEEDDDIFILEPIDQKPEIRPILLHNPLAVPFQFEIPSPKILKDLCEKLNINYNKQAYQLWLKIDFEEIPLISTTSILYEEKSKNIFDCFSLLYTGGTEQSFPIQYTINGAYRNKLLQEGIMTQKEIDRTFMPSTVSDEHLTFIAEFLNCRIGIFKDQELTRFGKWVSEADVLTVVLAHVDGYYSIVLNL